MSWRSPTIGCGRCSIRTGHLFVVSGAHFVNRLGYFISTVATDEALSFCVDLEAEMIEEGGQS